MENSYGTYEFRFTPWFWRGQGTGVGGSHQTGNHEGIFTRVHNQTYRRVNQSSLYSYSIANEQLFTPHDHSINKHTQVKRTQGVRRFLSQDESVSERARERVRAVRPINITPPINIIVPHKCHSASHKYHSSP